MFVLRTRKATVNYDPQQVTPEQIEAALARANASIAQANNPEPAALDLLSSSPRTESGPTT